MWKLRTILLALLVAAAASAVTFAVVTTVKPKPACACSIERNLRGPARDAAVRFEALVRQGDAPATWALLTDSAQSRYVDVAGFQPVFDRLTKAFSETPAAAGWLAVADQSSDVVVVRYATDRPRMVWPLLVHASLGDERIDPEPPTLQLMAVSDGDGVRVELPDGDLNRASFTTIDSTGRDSLPQQEHVTEGVDRLTWTRPIQGPVLAIVVEKSGAGLRVGAATATVG